MCRIPETSATYLCKESMKKWHGHNLQVSVWEPTATRHGGLAAITLDKREVVSQMSHSYALCERRTSGAGGLLASTGGSGGAAECAASCLAGSWPWEGPWGAVWRNGQGKGPRSGGVRVCGESGGPGEWAEEGLLQRGGLLGYRA